MPKLWLNILLLLSLLLSSCSPSSLRNPCNKHLPQGLPKGTKASNQLLVRDIYCLSNNGTTKFADWVAYRLDASILTGSASQKRDWQADPDLDPAVTLEPEDYRGAHEALGTDRGHLAPLASFRGANWIQVNYLSNITPQRSQLNQGVWQELEQQVRDWARQGTVYVITGTAYLKPEPPLPQADEPHVVPSGFWKVVTHNGQVSAYFFDQDSSAQDPKEGEIPLENLERLVKLDFAENGYK
ncbi:DNA/RNA non-specific endonuclease [Prochlorothrix hollandica]|uniref:Endonuclease n=1 Tax=Prochlorothrix hollandica PCC 9006 = CALU 1027 TaxID=317619 RepID=A0A0M2PXI2_PROHO|nr:DNA/RNA non-specific endonuclease [Prochlorothrix hollandica]KKJ01146.1 hypothetical protein PROH_01760 [Prochlorothrix hollandica PCC 9006 = CALU 1027]